MGYSSDRMIFDMSLAQIDGVRFDGNDMIFTVSGAAAENEENEKKCFIPRLEIRFKDYSFGKIICPGRKLLRDGKVYETKDKPLYRSEVDDFRHRLEEENGGTLSFKEGSGRTVAEIFSEDGISAYSVEIFGRFYACWDSFGAEVKKNRRTLREISEQIMTEVPAAALAMSHKDTPRLAKVICAVAVGYALSPIDLIPDFVPVIGYIDDIIVLWGLIYMAVRLIPDDVMEECREKSRGMWDNGKPKKWYYGLPVIIIWLIIIALIISAIIK